MNVGPSAGLNRLPKQSKYRSHICAVPVAIAGNI